jgi:hypothetical protein
LVRANYPIFFFTFSIRTRQQVQESPLRDEIKMGTVVTTPKPSAQNNNAGGSVGTGSGGKPGGKKGSFKKN